MHENEFELYPMTLTTYLYNDDAKRTLLCVAKQEVYFFDPCLIKYLK